jgi:hypothetical protein
MSSSENKRALVWLSVAVVFFLAVLWWKGDSIFGNDTPKPGPNGKTKNGPANVGKKKGEPKPFKPYRSADKNAKKYAIKVVDDKTGKPLEGARVVLFTQQAKCLAEEMTDAKGSVEARPRTGNVHAVAAFHKDYSIQAEILKSESFELRLTPVRYMNLTITNLGPAQKEFHKTSNGAVTYKFARTFNPFAAKPDYIRFKMYEHMGLRESKFPFTANPVKIPKYLVGVNAKVRFVTAPSLPNHLDSTGLRSQEPTVTKAPTTESTPTDSAANLETFSIVAPPLIPGALIVHHKRAPGQDGILMLNVSFLDRAKLSADWGALISATKNPSTYEESDGNVTFKVYELQRTVAHLKLLHFQEGTRETISCNPVEVDGLTEVTLSPLNRGKVSIDLTGERAEGETANIIFFDEFHEPAYKLRKYTKGKETTHFTDVPPITHRIFAHDTKFASGIHEIRLKPGEHRRLKIEMKPACKVTVLVNRTPEPDSVIVIDKTTGNSQSYPAFLWDRFFLSAIVKEKNLSLTGHRTEFFLAQGAYEFGVKRGGVVTKKAVVLDAATKLVRIE